MNPILITGAAGFIGSRVARRLLAEGRPVRALDNFDPFYSGEIKQRNLAELRAAAASPADFELVEGDIRNPDDCRRAVAGCSAILHFAALAGVRPSIAAPIRYMDVNVAGTQTLLCAVPSPEIPVVFVSSSSVYGGNKKVPFAEHDAVDHPVSPYAASKKAGEVVCYSFHHLRGNPVTCLRFFTVYGPAQRPEMAIHMFSRRIMDGEAITLFGDGSTSRDYTYVSDIVDGVLAALDRATGYQIYNLGGSTTTTLQELVTTLEDVLGRPAIIDRLPEQPGDLHTTWADVSLAGRDLDYSPKVHLREGLERFAEWFLRNRGQR